MSDAQLAKLVYETSRDAQDLKVLLAVLDNRVNRLEAASERLETAAATLVTHAAIADVVHTQVESNTAKVTSLMLSRAAIFAVCSVAGAGAGILVKILT